MFLTTRHKWCLWHVMKKVPQKFSRHNEYFPLFIIYMLQFMIHSHKLNSRENGKSLLLILIYKRVSGLVVCMLNEIGGYQYFWSITFGQECQLPNAMRVFMLSLMGMSTNQLHWNSLSSNMIMDFRIEHKKSFRLVFNLLTSPCLVIQSLQSKDNFRQYILMKNWKRFKLSLGQQLIVMHYQHYKKVLFALTKLWKIWSLGIDQQK